jgi:hypothetical protein
MVRGEANGEVSRAASVTLTGFLGPMLNNGARAGGACYSHFSCE